MSSSSETMVKSRSARECLREGPAHRQVTVSRQAAGNGHDLLAFASRARRVGKETGDLHGEAGAARRVATGDDIHEDLDVEAEGGFLLVCVLHHVSLRASIVAAEA